MPEMKAVKRLTPTAKLVRDKLDQRIPADELSLASEWARPTLLAAKLDEEVSELRNSGFADVLEFADVFEVLLSLAHSAGHSADDIEGARRRKLQEKGGFDRLLVWNPPAAAARKEKAR